MRARDWEIRQNYGYKISIDRYLVITVGSWRERSTVADYLAAATAAVVAACLHAAAAAETCIFEFGARIF